MGANVGGWRRRGQGRGAGKRGGGAGGWARLGLLLLVGSLQAGCDALAGIGPLGDKRESPYEAIVPHPVVATEAVGVEGFTFSEATEIHVADASFLPAARLLAATLRPSTGLPLPVRVGEGLAGGAVVITASADPELGEEGYLLRVEPERVTILAPTPAGAVWAVQTLRQLLPARVERPGRQSGEWTVAAGEVRDFPRYSWRGAMLDVARHFFTVDEVKRFIDVLSLYKLNRLHLHLTDDQGWRLMIESWPNLALHGGSLEVGGTAGGFYTQAEYAELVAYAADRGIVVVPEIEMPGHSHAALASYPELSCETEAPPLYTGIVIGFSTFCFLNESLYDFVEDVLAEVAALTPGPFIHIGADEVYVLPREEYARFIPDLEAILTRLGKRMVGWEEIGTTDIGPPSIVQFWDRDARLQAAVDRGVEIILSPSRLAYMDSKYNPRTPIGRTWTSEFLDVRKAYAWDPLTVAPADARVIGVEGPLWTETVREYREVEYLAFPRLIGLGEIGWSPAAARDWDGYRRRLGRQAPRLEAIGVNYYRSPEVPWK